MPGGGVVTNNRSNTIPQAVVETLVSSQDDKKDHPDIACPVLPHDNALLHFRQPLYLTIDFSGADAHSPGIQHSVRSTVNNVAAVGSAFAVITVGPGIGPLGKIGPAILRVVGIVPEPDGHTGKGSSTNQFTLLTHHGFTVFVPYFHGHAQTRRLYFANTNRPHGAADNEAGQDIGAATDR